MVQKEITRLKRAFKKAIRSGKIYFVGENQINKRYNNFENFVKHLDERLWKEFQVNEKRFRLCVTRKLYNYGDFICKGNFEHWVKLMKIIKGYFYRNNDFVVTNLRRAIPFIKYISRILKTLPTNPTYEGNDRISFIKSQIEYFCEEIQPILSPNRNTNKEKLSKEELTKLWLSKRKLAIKVIKNDGYYPQSIDAIISRPENEQYFCQNNRYVLRKNLNESEKYFTPLANDDVIQPFSTDEIRNVTFSCPDHKSAGKDGIKYEDIKSKWGNIEADIRNIFEIVTINRRIPDDWKQSIIRRIPKKNYDPLDLSTLRDISLMLILYKIFVKCLCIRLLPYITDKVSFWQRAYMSSRSRQDLIFMLKTFIDDFKHKTNTLLIAFIDFADAFGSLNHTYMFETLQLFNIPNSYCMVIEDIYRYSNFRVICNGELSDEFCILRGTKTGDPLSGFLFVMCIDRIFQPMVETAIIHRNIQDERMLNPLPVQGYADDIANISNSENEIQKLFQAAEPEMNKADLYVKPSKCALFNARRSGNNWYTSKQDKKPKVIIQGNILDVYTRKKCYVYLGKSICIEGEDKGQVNEIIETYKELVQKICESELPLTLKVNAINEMALGKVLHHFDNTCFDIKDLDEIDKYLTKKVKTIFELYPSTTNTIIYLPREKGGIGIKKFSDVYICSRIAFLTKMLNHKEERFKFITRESFKLDMKKRGVNECENVTNFLGYEVNDRGFFKATTKFGCETDWISLLRYCRKLGVTMKWVGGQAKVQIGNNFYDDEENLKKRLFNLCIEKKIEYAKNLTLQGNYVKINNINGKMSNTIQYNWKLDDFLYKFYIKAKLNILATNFTKFIWNRQANPNPNCTTCNKTESVAHLLNGCNRFKNFYTRRHDRVCEKLAIVFRKEIQNVNVYENKLVGTLLPDLHDRLANIQHRKPDIFIINNEHKSIFIVEVTVCYDIYIEMAQESKTERYEPLCLFLRSVGYKVELFIMCFGSLGTITNKSYNAMTKLQLSNTMSKNTLKWCSISNIIGANYIWRHRCRNTIN